MARVQPAWNAASSRGLTASSLFGLDAVDRSGRDDSVLEDLDAIASIRPVFLLVRDADDADRASRVEDQLLADERLLITGKLFRFARVDDDDVRLLEELRGLGTGVVLTTAEGNVAARLFGRKCTSASVYRAMQRIAEETYEGSLSRFQKDFREALNEYERVDTKRFALQDRRVRAKTDADAADLDQALERIRSEEEDAKRQILDAFRHVRPRETASS